MCRRVIQSSAPLRYAIVDGISARHSTAADGCAIIGPIEAATDAA